MRETWGVLFCHYTKRDRSLLMRASILISYTFQQGDVVMGDWSIHWRARWHEGGGAFHHDHHDGRAVAPIPIPIIAIPTTAKASVTGNGKGAGWPAPFLDLAVGRLMMA